jgi:hypothetical protein
MPGTKPVTPKKWIISAIFASDLGDIDVDFAVDDLEHAHQLIMRQKDGYQAVKGVMVQRNPMHHEAPRTIEELAACSTKAES